jgi:predicted enzyme related to lactoylglutathione lyase
MELTFLTTFITVHDADLALAFYRDTLGLTLTNDVSAGDFRWLTLSPARQPDVQIVLTHPHAGRSQEDGDAMEALMTKGSLPPIFFRTADVDADFEKVQASGVEVLQEPMDQGWGARDCAFRDPSGNTVRLSQQPVRD